MTKIEKAKRQAFKNADFSRTLPARSAWKKGFDAAVEILTRKHKFWGAGEKDCPRNIKAPNGELHTLRCKVCGEEGSRGFCLGFPVKPSIPSVEEKYPDGYPLEVPDIAKSAK